MRTPKPSLSSVRFAIRSKRSPSCLSACIAALFDTLTFHIGNLGKHSHHKLTNAFGYRSKALHIYDDTFAD